MIELLLIVIGKHGAIELEEHSGLIGDFVIVQIGDDSAKLSDLLIVLLRVAASLA